MFEVEKPVITIKKRATPIKTIVVVSCSHGQIIDIHPMNNYTQLKSVLHQYGLKYGRYRMERLCNKISAGVMAGLVIRSGITLTVKEERI